MSNVARMAYELQEAEQVTGMTWLVIEPVETQQAIQVSPYFIDASYHRTMSYIRDCVAAGDDETAVKWGAELDAVAAELRAIGCVDMIKINLNTCQGDIDIDTRLHGWYTRHNPEGLQPLDARLYEKWAAVKWPVVDECEPFGYEDYF